MKNMAKAYWFKGGIIMSFIGIIVLFILRHIHTRGCTGREAGEAAMAFWNLLRFFGWPLVYTYVGLGLGGGFSSLGVKLVLVFGLLVNITYLFIIGALISIIYKKNKFIFSLFLLIFLVIVVRTISNYSHLCSQDLSIFADTRYLHLAIERLNPAFCKKIKGPGHRDACYHQIASIRKDPFLCEKLQNHDSKYYCYKELSPGRLNKPSVCEGLNTAKNNCYWDIAILRKDYSLCEKIKQQQYQNRCYYNIANQTGNRSICERIEDEQDLREKCYQGRKNDINQPGNIQPASPG